MCSNSTTIVLVSCVSRKREKPSAARDLYTSPWFFKARRYAESSGFPWFVLSAKYGLVSPERIIEPYERTLNTMPAAERHEWAEQASQQIDETIPNLSRVVFLAGKRYREFLSGYLLSRGVLVSIPMEGLRIGEQLNWLEQNTPGSAA
ncbi:DUF6884 domain-containing protein [Zobellella denitrificans]|uniref:DUF6884 domain-containing protein n=1 Tax=Zobellella denitrificans TaxID=347534 RepID=UPI000BBE7D7C